MIRCYVLRGGMWGTDGPWSSPGMDGLAQQIGQIPTVTVTVHNWSDYMAVRGDVLRRPVNVPIVFVGYSGGGWKAAAIAGLVGDRAIELVIALDPSPSYWMDRTPLGANVKSAICYYNTAPMLFGAGGGMLRGKQVVVRQIRENHLSVQFDAAIRKEVVVAVASVAAG